MLINIPFPERDFFVKNENNSVCFRLAAMFAPVPDHACLILETRLNFIQETADNVWELSKQHVVTFCIQILNTSASSQPELFNILIHQRSGMLEKL